MAIRDAARQAWVAARSDREDEARGYLAELLAPFNVAALETVDVQVTDAYTLFVLRDPEDDVHLAVRSRSDAWEAFVVTDDGGWTQHGDPVRSLAHLWELLPEVEVEEPEPEPAPPAWVQPTGAHDAYAKGDMVTYNGKVWESTVDGNVWAPGVSGWREVTV